MEEILRAMMNTPLNQASISYCNKLSDKLGSNSVHSVTVLLPLQLSANLSQLCHDVP
jgi:hypothetical protein